MGLFLRPLPCQPNEDSDLNSLSSSSLSSESSLPSIPSLTPRSTQPPSSSHHLVATLDLHSSAIFSLCLAGEHLISSSSDGEIRTWPRIIPPVFLKDQHNLIACGHSAVKSIVFSGDKLFTAHQDHKIRAWKFEDEKLKFAAVLPTVHDRFTRIFSAKNYVQVRRHVKCTWVNHVDTVSTLAFTRDKKFLYSGSWDRSFKIWKVSNFKCVESVWNAHDDAINALILSSDGVVYTGSGDRKIKVWEKEKETKKHRLVMTLEEHKSAINALALSTDGTVLYSGACDRSIIVWEKTNNVMMAVGALRGHKKAVLCLAVAGDLLFSGSADKTIRIWKRHGYIIGNGNYERKYSCLGVLEGHKGPVKSLKAAMDSDESSRDSSTISFKVYSGSLDCEIKFWHFSCSLS